VIYDKPNSERITSPFMTKYEKARIIGVRATQISKNSPLYLTADSNSLMNWDPLTIA
jgi:DNA-directed RNA polymerase I, II, and III subunit RPABC2